jgi:hypothetical protein
MQEHNQYKHSYDHYALGDFATEYYTSDDDPVVYWIDEHGALVVYDNSADKHLTGAAQARAIADLLDHVPAVYLDAAYQRLHGAVHSHDVPWQQQLDERLQPEQYRDDELRGVLANWAFGALTNPCLGNPIRELLAGLHAALDG